MKPPRKSDAAAEPSPENRRAWYVKRVPLSWPFRDVRRKPRDFASRLTASEFGESRRRHKTDGRR